MGFGEHIGVLDDQTTKDELVARYRERMPNAKEGTVLNAASQLLRFHREIALGDQVATYDAEQRLYLLGTVTGEPEFVGDSDDHDKTTYRRSVRWEAATPRDALSLTTRNTLGSILTLFLVNETAAQELCSLQEPLTQAEAERAQPALRPGAKAAEGVNFEELKDEIAEKSNQFIEDIIAALDPYELQDLVGGVLRAMGYKTRVAQPGPDRGIDIFASPDGLGLEEPRVFVEVKHRQAKMGSPELRSFLGGRQPGDRCLYVSTGGFTQEARYEAERANVPLTLVDLPMLRRLITEHYEGLDQETRQLVPLTRLYWPLAGGN